MQKKFRLLSCVIFSILIWNHVCLGQSNCGSYSVITNPNLQPYAYDQFGNPIYPVQESATVAGSVNTSYQSGYFSPTFFGNPPAQLQEVVSAVMQYISNVIPQRQDVSVCGNIPNQKVNIQVLWGDFSNTSAQIWSQLSIDPNSLVPSKLGIGSAFFSPIEEPTCKEVAVNYAFAKVNGGRPTYNGIYSESAFDGRIIINSNPIPLDLPQGCSSVSWNFNQNQNAQPCEYDLYSIVLHELLHSLGIIASSFEKDYFSVWEKQLHTTNSYTTGGGGSNIQPLLENITPTECETNCWKYITNAESLVKNSCTGTTDVVAGSGAWAPLGLSGSASPSDLTNLFAHLHPNCKGQPENFVMRPSFSAGETVRLITNQEQRILCEMGFQTSLCTGCLNLPLTDVWNEFERCCYKTHYACAGESVTIQSSDLLCNDLSSSELEVTRVWMQPTNAVIEFQPDGNGGVYGTQ